MTKKWWVYDREYGISGMYDSEAEASVVAEERVITAGGECCVLELTTTYRVGNVIRESPSE